MLAILLGAAGLLLGLTLIAVYSAFVIAHRTDDLVARIEEEGFTGDKPLLGRT